MSDDELAASIKTINMPRLETNLALERLAPRNARWVP
jgi:hypothetical protein